LDTLRAVFGPGFEHQRHCVWSAVSVQLATINVAGHHPHAGATSFRAEVVGVRVSGNAGRELSGFLLSIAGMDAIGDYLTAWEQEQVPRTGVTSSATTALEDPNTGGALPPEDHLRHAVYQSTQVCAETGIIAGLTEDESRCAVYGSTYMAAWNDMNDGLTEGAIRSRYESVIQAAGRRADVVREAVDDALAGLTMRYKSGFYAQSLKY
jgi:hypothetical protein